jgi:hypothetical protein
MMKALKKDIKNMPIEKQSEFLELKMTTFGLDVIINKKIVHIKKDKFSNLTMTEIDPVYEFDDIMEATEFLGLTNIP